MPGQDTVRNIPLKERVGHVILAVLLLAYGAYGLRNDDLYIPGKRSRGVHLHGTAAWVMYGAFVCAALNLLAVAVDHCDTSGGEKNTRSGPASPRSPDGPFLRARCWGACS